MPRTEVTLVCPNCQTPMFVADIKIGNAIQCPHCEHIIHVGAGIDPAIDSIDALSEEEAQHKIRQMGYFVTKITEVGNKRRAAQAADDDAEDEDMVYISPWAFVRTMLLIAWSAFRHPFSYTTIHMLTGDSMHYTK